jgi:hypothetical protein
MHPNIPNCNGANENAIILSSLLEVSFHKKAVKQPGFTTGKTVTAASRKPQPRHFLTNFVH